MRSRALEVVGDGLNYQSKADLNLIGFADEIAPNGQSL